MMNANEFPRGPTRLLAAAALAVALGLAGCAHNAPAGQASDTGSGVTVYGTVDAGVGRTAR